MTKSIFTAESQFSRNWVLTTQIGAQGVPELRSLENKFLWPNRTFHEIGCSRPKSAHKQSPSSDHEKISFYDRVTIFMKLGANGPIRRRRRRRAQIMRKLIFTAKSHCSWNWVLTAQIGEIAVFEFTSWENQFLRPNRNFHEIGFSRPKSAHKPSPTSDHEKINFFRRIAIFVWLGAKGQNRRRSRPRAQIMRKSIFTTESQFSWALAQIMRKSIFTTESQFSWALAQMMRKSIFTAESRFSWNWVLTAQIGAEAVPEFRSWENIFTAESQFSWNWVLTA